MPPKYTYTIELESSRIGTPLTDAVLNVFNSHVRSNRKLAAPSPKAAIELGRLELRARVVATGPTNALAIAEVAFLRAADRAGVRVVIAEACVRTNEDGSAPG